MIAPSRRVATLAGIFVVAVTLSFDVALNQRAFSFQENWETASRQTQLRLLELGVGSLDYKAFANASKPAATEPTISHPLDRPDEDLSVNFTAVDDSIASKNDPGPKSPYTYAFVIGGCDIEKKKWQGYKGFFYNVLVATKILREEGSTADVVAYFQISYKAEADVLPKEDTRLLAALGIRVKYMPKSEHQSFYETVMQKFRVLALTEYRKVILMDGDIMPITNLDYLFELSDKGVIEENLIVTGAQEPSNAGFFMVSPISGAYENVLQIVHDREVKAAAIPDGEHKFDEEWGFGHKITEPDYWRSRKEKGRKWNFHFAFSDQGLLYHYTKYVRKSVSMVYGRGVVENWNGNDTDPVALRLVPEIPFSELRELRIRDVSSCNKFMCDFVHFSGRKKPWLHKPVKNYDNKDASNSKDPEHVWWNTLYNLDNEHEMGLDFDKWLTGNRPSLGLYATFVDMDKSVNRKASQVSTQAVPKEE